MEALNGVSSPASVEEAVSSPSVNLSLFGALLPRAGLSRTVLDFFTGVLGTPWTWTFFPFSEEVVARSTGQLFRSGSAGGQSSPSSISSAQHVARAEVVRRSGSDGGRTTDDGL